MQTSDATRVRRTRIPRFDGAAGTGSATDPSVGTGWRRGSDPSVSLNALAEQLGVSPAALETAIQKTRQAQGQHSNASEQPTAFDPISRAQRRAVRTQRAAEKLGVEPRGLYQALKSASDLPSGSNPLQFVAQQLSADPNALMTAMQQSGLSFVDQYA